MSAHLLCKSKPTIIKPFLTTSCKLGHFWRVSTTNFIDYFWTDFKNISYVSLFLENFLNLTKIVSRHENSAPTCATAKNPSNSYLPGRGVNRDHEGGSPRARPFHCTPVGLTPAISPNVGNSTALFVLVGICVRANPCKTSQAKSAWRGPPEGSGPEVRQVLGPGPSACSRAWHGNNFYV